MNFRVSSRRKCITCRSLSKLMTRRATWRAFARRVTGHVDLTTGN